MIPVENRYRLVFRYSYQQDCASLDVLSQPVSEIADLREECLIRYFVALSGAERLQHLIQREISARQFSPLCTREHTNAFQILRPKFHLKPFRALGKFSQQGAVT